MRRIFLVLALALTLLIGVCGQAHAGQIDNGDDHPWGGSTSSGEQPQYRHEIVNNNIVLSTGIFPIDVILSDHIFLNELRNIFNGVTKTDNLYLEKDMRDSRSGTRQERLR